MRPGSTLAGIDRSRSRSLSGFMIHGVESKASRARSGAGIPKAIAVSIRRVDRLTQTLRSDFFSFRLFFR